MSTSIGSDLIKKFPQCQSVLAAVSDQNGVLRGKRYPLTAVDKVMAGQSRLPLSLCNLDIWGLNIKSPLPDFLAGDRDGNCEWTGRLPMPTNWLRGDSLLIPLTMSDDNGAPFLGDPRRVLEWVLARYRTSKLTPVVAVELEFYLTLVRDRTPVAPVSPVSGESLLPTSALPLTELEHFSEFIDDVYQACENHGIALEAAIAECGAGQFEINIVHNQDALKAADDATYFKHLVKSIARKHGLIASFMAKPYLDQPGNGMHIHFNVLDENGDNLFADGTDKGAALLHHAVAGALQTIPADSLIFAPHLNSYRRFEQDSHAPTHVNWGYENRTAAIRIPGGDVNAKRIEHRVAGADANPYLVTAAILSSCLQGLRAELNPPAPLDGSEPGNVESTPLLTDWRLAQQSFIDLKSLDKLLPNQFVTMFAACKQQEISTFDKHMSAFELTTYLEIT